MKRDDVTFLAVGDGDKLSATKQIIDHRFRDRLLFPGIQDDIESLVNIFDVAVLSSNEEGIPNSVLEYMALAKPVVATDVGGTNELVSDNLTGFLVRRGDAWSLGEKIEALLDDPTLAMEMGQAGKRRIQSEFTLARMTERFIELYHDVTNR